MNLAPIQNDLAKTIRRNELGIGVPESQYMIPGKTYVGRLPGHSRKVFVRKPLLQVAHVHAALPLGTATSHAVGRPEKMPRWLRSMLGSGYETYDDRFRRRRVIYSDGAHYGIHAPRTVPSARQVCSACGKFRSPSWSARHPVGYGEVPKSRLCRKCAGKSTSSAETPWLPRRRRPRARCSRSHHSHCAHNEYSSYDSSRDGCRSRRRYRSASLGYIRPRSLAGSGERVNIVIRNEGVTPRPRLRTMSSSDGSVRVIRHTTVDRPVHRRSVRSLSSDSSFTDEEIIPRRRPLSRARARSRSSVHFVDELEETRHRSRPRSLSRHSSVEEIIVSRPRRSSRRRRPAYWDGPADANERSESSAIGGKRMGITDILPRPITSGSRRSSSSEFDEIPWLNTTGQARVENCSENLHTLPHVTQDQFVPDRAWMAFSEPGYEVDSQFPSPPSVTFAIPLRRRLLRPPLPSHVSNASAPSKARDSKQVRRHTEPLSPAYSEDEYFTAVPRQTSYERVRHYSEPLSPPDSHQDLRKAFNFSEVPTSNSIGTNATAIAADNPDHPDHLAFLLSTAQALSSIKENGGEGKENNRERNTHVASLMIPRDHHKSTYDENARADSVVCSLDGGPKLDNLLTTGFQSAMVEEYASSKDEFADHTAEDGDEDFRYDQQRRRRRPLHDIFDAEELGRRHCETQIDYEAEGRVHMQVLGQRIAMRRTETAAAVAAVAAVT